MQHKASPLKIKTFGDTPGTFSGYASIYDAVDSYNDAVCRGAFSKTMQEKGGKIVILNQHNPEQPIGIGTLTDHQRGLFIEGVLELGTQAGAETYALLKAGIISSLSIGYETVRDEVPRSTQPSR
jgi:HK97 family phage prohead protease